MLEEAHRGHALGFDLRRVQRVGGDFRHWWYWRCRRNLLPGGPRLNSVPANGRPGLALFQAGRRTEQKARNRRAAPREEVFSAPVLVPGPFSAFPDTPTG